MKNFTQEEIKEIISSYENGISRRKISSIYNVSDSVILRVLKENNIEIRNIQKANSKRKFNIDDNYFDIESPNMAYIMGFWAADGNVSSKENRLDLELASVDYEILEKIRKELKSERPIKTYECANGYVKNKLLFWSARIKDKFAEYGIVPNKTYSKDFHAPYKLNEEYWVDYIRGFFDGDGCVKKYNSLTFELNSVNYQFLEDIRLFLIKKYNISGKITTCGTKDRNIPLYRLYYMGDKAYSIFDILYTPNSLFLTRKYNKWIELK